MTMVSFAFRCLGCLVLTFVGMSLETTRAEIPWSPPVIAQPTRASLRSVCAVDADCAWAGGSQGTVHRTTDGGTTWQQVGPTQWNELEFRSVWALTSEEAVIASAGTPAIILHTEDGGKSWNEVYRNTAQEAFFDGLRFWDAQNGLAFSDPVNGQWLIVRTSDGGRNWKEINPRSLPAAEPGEAGFAASNTALALTVLQDASKESRLAWIGLGGSTGNSSRILYSADGGTSWSVRQISEIPRNASSGVFGIAFLPPNTLVAVGGDYRQETRGEDHIAISMDMGMSWRLPSKRLPSGFRSGITAIPGVGFVCVGPSGVEFSKDGEDWELFDAPGFHAVTHDREGNLWCVGSEGRIGIFRRSPR